MTKIAAAALSLLLGPAPAFADAFTPAVLRFQNGESFRFQHHVQRAHHKGNPIVRDLRNARRHLVSTVMKSVVMVTVQAPPPPPQNGPTQDELKGMSPRNRRLFREFFGIPPQQGETPSPSQPSTGSGAIFRHAVGGRSRKLVVTNHHVVDGRVGAEVELELHDASKRKAVVVGSNEQYDIAFLDFKEPCDDRLCPALELGNSDELELGDEVFAFGAPFGLPRTVTRGIVGALKRDLDTRGLVYDFVQTDAAINRGNSGGALVDWDEKIMAINTAIISPSGGSVGVGMATPSNHVIMLAERFIRTNSITPSRIGAGVEMDGKGVKLKNIAADSPAGKAGLRDGDVVIQAEEVTSFGRVEDLMRVISRMTPGVDSVRLRVRRGNQVLEFRVPVIPPAAAPKP